MPETKRSYNTRKKERAKRRANLKNSLRKGIMGNRMFNQNGLTLGLNVTDITKRPDIVTNYTKEKGLLRN